MKDRTADMDSALLHSLQWKKPFFEYFVPREKLFSCCLSNYQFILSSMKGESVLFWRVIGGSVTAQRLLPLYNGLSFLCLILGNGRAAVTEESRVWDRQDMVGWPCRGCLWHKPGPQAASGKQETGQFIEEKYMLPLIYQPTLYCQREAGNYYDICPRDIFRSWVSKEEGVSSKFVGR